LGEGTAREAGSAVDHHPAAAADPGPAHEVELQRRVVPLADLVEGDEQRHAVRLFELVGLHAGAAAGLLRVVAQDVEGEPAAGVVVGHGQNLSSMRSLRPRKQSGMSSSYGMRACWTAKRSDDTIRAFSASTSFWRFAVSGCSMESLAPYPRQPGGSPMVFTSIASYVRVGSVSASFFQTASVRLSHSASLRRGQSSRTCAPRLSVRVKAA